MEDHRFADTFDPKTERIEDYKERFDFYCVAHGVEEAKQKVNHNSPELVGTSHNQHIEYKYNQNGSTYMYEGLCEGVHSGCVHRCDSVCVRMTVEG